MTIDGSNEQLSPVLRFFYIQLPFAKEEENAEYVTSLESWTYILHNMEALTLPRYSENKIFNYLKEVTDVAALSPEQRRRYERDLTNYWDACALDDEYERRKKELEDWEQELEDKEQELEDWEQKIKDRKQEIEARKQEIEARRREIEAREKELENRYMKAKDDGLSQRIAQNELEIARNLKRMNMPLADISKATGLSIEEINAID